MKRLAVLGHPVAHSRSPAMQTAALEAAGLGAEWSYGAIDVEPQALPAKVADLLAAGYAGANVTLPHKEAALLLSSRTSERAAAIGAVNTLSFDGEQIAGENTDASGIAMAIAGLGRLPAGPALVVGAGGSARAATWSLRDSGRAVAVWNRTRARAESLAADLGAEVAEREPALGEFAIIVNATPVGLGLEGGGEEHASGAAGRLKGFPIAADGLTDRQVVVDLAYGSVETPVIAAARQAGARFVDGLEVLVRQGAESFRIWTGIDPPLDVMRRAARAGGST